MIKGATRRVFLGNAFAATAAIVARDGTFAQQLQTHLPKGVSPKTRGPVVFLDYDQEELDLAYDQAPWSPNQAELTRRNAQKTAAVIARLGSPRRLRYGPSEIEQLDLFATSTPNAPIQVFIHGGARGAGSAAAFE